MSAVVLLLVCHAVCTWAGDRWTKPRHRPQLSGDSCARLQAQRAGDPGYHVTLPDHPDGEYGGIGVLYATRRGRDATND